MNSGIVAHYTELLVIARRHRIAMEDNRARATLVYANASVADCRVLDAVKRVMEIDEEITNVATIYQRATGGKP